MKTSVKTLGSKYCKPGKYYFEIQLSDHLIHSQLSNKKYHIARQKLTHQNNLALVLVCYASISVRIGKIHIFWSCYKYFN